MFFEGSEKKATIIIDNTRISLLNNMSNVFWQNFVAACHAKILSSTENECCKAFLLSESSLFVWHDRLTILTCGNTRLVHAIEYFIQQFGMENIKHVSYQRKNEYFAHAQPSSFGDDIKLLNQYMPARAYRLGELDSHHNYIFHQNNGYRVAKDNKTYELLAYQISAQASEELTKTNLLAIDVRNFLSLNSLFEGFKINDFVFQPFGYSVNGIRGDDYFTIHVTPQANSSYVSIESNLNLIELTPEILTILQPRSFDLLSSNELEFAELVKCYIPKAYVSKAFVRETLNNHMHMCFANYIMPQHNFMSATVLDVAGENHAL